jgi:hypothetical protein
MNVAKTNNAIATVRARRRRPAVIIESQSRHARRPS